MLLHVASAGDHAEYVPLPALKTGPAIAECPPHAAHLPMQDHKDRPLSDAGPTQDRGSLQAQTSQPARAQHEDTGSQCMHAHMLKLGCLLLQGCQVLPQWRLRRADHAANTHGAPAGPGETLL